MSRTWWLTTNTNHQLEDVRHFLIESGAWGEVTTNPKYHRLIAESKDEGITLVGSDGRKRNPGTRESRSVTLGTPRTISFTQELSRSLDHCGRLDQIYEFAFRFASWDENCDLYFELEDLGIFKRINGIYTVNPDQFFAKSLACFLTFPYRLADSDKRAQLVASA